MNLSLQIDFFEVGDEVADERLVIDLGDETDLGDDKHRFDRNGVVSFAVFEIVVSSLSVVCDILDGKFSPLFLLCSNSIFYGYFFFQQKD